jgi:hypothetical protein
MILAKIGHFLPGWVEKIGVPYDQVHFSERFF